jgi:hypothetical protein
MAERENRNTESERQQSSHDGQPAHEGPKR